MGWRFQKRVRLMPGVTLNFSRKGVSTSFGTRGARVTLGHGQRRTTVGIPGSGISHTAISKKSGARQRQSRRAIASTPAQSSSVQRLLKLVLIACALFFFALVFAGSAWAINKCTGADGKVVFQDAPCAGKGESVTVRPASGASPRTSASTEAQRIEQQVAESQKERRLRELTQRELPGAEAAVQQNLSTCAAEQESLKNGQYRYVQNLYGKTHAAQMAAEMAAAASRCETRDRELRDRVERLKAECQKLGGCG